MTSIPDEVVAKVARNLGFTPPSEQDGCMCDDCERSRQREWLCKKDEVRKGIHAYRAAMRERGDETERLRTALSAIKDKFVVTHGVPGLRSNTMLSEFYDILLAAAEGEKV